MLYSILLTDKNPEVLDVPTDWAIVVFILILIALVVYEERTKSR